MTATSRAPQPVVYVIASMIVGGTQTHLLQVFRFLDRSAFSPHLVCLRSDGTLLDAVRELEVPVTTLGVSGSMKHPRDLAGWWSLVRSLRRLRPAVVHGYLLRGNFYAATASRVARVPVVVTSKRGLHQPGSFSERLAVRISNSLSSAVTGNSPAVLDFTTRVEGAVRAPLVMIPSGIDTTRFDPRCATDLRADLGLQGQPVVGTVTTFRPKKGYPMLFETFARVARARPDARLVVAGEARWQAEPRALAGKLGILDKTILLGKRSDMPQVYRTFDVFVLASRSEGMSNALLEAMAMKLPVVATAVGGNVTVLADGRFGRLVESGDDRAMASLVLALLDSESDRRVLGEAARRRVEDEYSAQGMVRQMERLYRALLGLG